MTARPAHAASDKTAAARVLIGARSRSAGLDGATAAETTEKLEARDAVYANRRRIRGERGKRLMRKRGELLERSFAHAYETGGMRRVYLRGRENVLKRVLAHLGAFNLSLVMRQGLGKGTPRGWQGFSTDALLTLLQLWMVVLADTTQESASKTAARRSAPNLHSVRRRMSESLLPRTARLKSLETFSGVFALPIPRG